MEELRLIIGENLAELRKEKKLTQLELADKFNYSDKAISKWEKGDTLPDIETLYALCDFYGVTLDYLTHPGTRKEKSEYIVEDLNIKKRNNIISSALMLTIVWMIVTIIFVYVLIRSNQSLWVAFVWGVPASALVGAICNKLYFHKRIVYFFCYSILVWGIITGTYLTTLEINAWPLFFVGVPAQVLLILWSNLIKPTKRP